jgi:tetratricopeptide (TPR) repeat protein
MMKINVNLNQHVKRDPVTAEIRRIGALIEGKKLAEAEAEALKLLKAHSKRPDVHNILAVAYIQQEKLKLAVPHLESAVRAEPNNTHYLNNLGRLYLDLTLVELALPFLNKALAIDPKLTSALLAIGKYYTKVGKAELALPYFERLHEIVPRDNMVKMELAESLDVLGRNEEADKFYREFSRTPYQVESLYYYSRHDPPEGTAALIAEIEDLLQLDTLTDRSRSRLHTALGFAHEKEGNYPLAFQHFERAGRLRPVNFSIEDYRAWVDGVINVFTADFFRERANVGSPSSLPVLVVGMPRSGTTLTEQMIASHGRAGGAGELTRIWIFAQRLFYSPQRDITRFIPSLDALGAKGLREMGDSYVDLLKFHAPKAERVVDKLPHNFQTLGLAVLMCPNVRIIHCSRNPVDTCWSCFQNPLHDQHAYSKDLTNAGLYYRQYKRLMDHWKTVLPVPIYELNYERLTADFESEARKVIDFIGLPWDEACLKFHEAGRTVRTFSRQQVRSPVYKSSVERWRRYEKELQPLLSALGDLA